MKPGENMLYKLYIKLLNQYNYLKQRCWNLYQGKQCTWRGDTFFFLSATVNNMSRKRENICLGEACKIRGELVVYPYVML